MILCYFAKLLKICEILQKYTSASGQSINMQKSSVYFSENTPCGQRQVVVLALGVCEVERFDTYLGLPSLIEWAKYQIFFFPKG